MSATNVSSISSRQHSFSSSSSEAAKEEPFPILDLPKELYGHICKFLNLQDIQSLTCATKTLRDITLEEANHNQLVAVRLFMETLCLKLASACPQQIALFDLQDQLLNKEAVPLSELKNKILMVKDQIIDILSTLDVSVCKDLSGITLPKFCEKVVVIATIMAKNLTAIAILNSEDMQRTHPSPEDPPLAALSEGCVDLIRNREDERAHKTINAILDKNFQKLVLKEISEIFIKNSEFEQALKIINLFSCKVDQTNCLSQIVKGFLEKGDIPQALKIAMMMPEPDNLEEPRLPRALALRNVVNALKEKGECEQAAEIFKMIPKNTMRILIMDKEYDEAMKVAKDTPDKKKREHHFKTIILALINEGNLEKAKQLANTIPNEVERVRVLRLIAQVVSWQKAGH